MYHVIFVRIWYNTKMFDNVQIVLVITGEFTTNESLLGGSDSPLGEFTTSHHWGEAIRHWRRIHYKLSLGGSDSPLGKFTMSHH